MPVFDSAVPKPDTWDQLLRKQIKLEHVRGWSVNPQSGKAKLTKRYPDGTRSSVGVAPVSWRTWRYLVAFGIL